MENNDIDCSATNISKNKMMHNMINLGNTIITRQISFVLLELSMKIMLTLKLEFTNSPGGWWLVDFTKLMLILTQVEVGVEVGAELSNNSNLN